VGAGSNYVCSLPDATTLAIGDQFEIINASSEFIIVKNSGTAGNSWRILAPTEVYIATCTSTSSAAGDWNISVLNTGLNGYYSEFNDFNHTSSDTRYLKLGEYGVVAGSGLVTSYNYTSATKRNGGIYVGTGPTPVSSALYHWQQQNIRFGTCCAMLEIGGVSISSLSDGTNTFTADIGFGNIATSIAEHTAAALFRYDQTQSVNFLAVTANNGTPTQVATTALVVTGEDRGDLLNIVVNTAGTRADFYFNRALTYTTTTTVPTGYTPAVAPQIRLTRTVGTAISRGVLADWARLVTVNSSKQRGIF
jgi:hypothetical protein